MNSNSAIFITLNPAGKGYGGRQKYVVIYVRHCFTYSGNRHKMVSQTVEEANERPAFDDDEISRVDKFIFRLPDNLKQLFRPVVMSAPDNELIAETELFSDGFKQAKSLAKKIVTLFTLSKLVFILTLRMTANFFPNSLWTGINEIALQGNVVRPAALRLGIARTEDGAEKLRRFEKEITRRKREEHCCEGKIS